MSIHINKMNRDLGIDNIIKSYIKQLEEVPITMDAIDQPQDFFENILRHIFSSKYRRTALDKASEIDIRNKVKASIQSGVPIKFSIPFGGYKNYRLPSYPEVDWAEVFNLQYIIKYTLPICAAYPPGVEVYYTYNSGIMQKISNMPINCQEAYEKSFASLLEYFNKRTPNNLKLTLLPINCFYQDKEAMDRELESLYLRNVQHWDSLYSEESRKRKLMSAKHNLILNGERNLLQLTDGELEQEYLKAAMLCDALDCLNERRKFNKYSDKIQLVFVRGPSNSIHIGVCEGSTMHFWVGTGVFEIRSERIIPKIFSFEQFNRQVIETKFMSEETPWEQISKNFKSIYLVR